MGKVNFKSVVMTNLKASPAKSAVLIIGFVVLVVLVARQVGGGASEAAAEVLVAVDVPAGVESKKDSENVLKPPPRVRRPRLPKTLARDPFALDWLVIDAGEIAGAEDADIEGDVLKLQLTLTGKDKSGRATAVVSGTVIHTGDEVAGFVVERIERRSVVLRKGQEEIRLRMP
ncbi:MAG: general secretion pathway protein GspB [Planctomycetes bacterium]|nr:general secretion pathway protein GspB [Planctomycetota bacterium]